MKSNSIHRILVVAACAFGCLALLQVRAAEIWRKSGANDGAGKSSFNEGTNWNGGSAPSKGNTYKWTAGTFRTPDKNSGTYVFQGDRISFGEGATVAHKTRGAGIVNFPEVVFGWEGSNSKIVWNIALEAQTSKVAGKVTIATPSDTPLKMTVGIGKGNVFLLNNAFVGVAGTGVAFTHYSITAGTDVKGTYRLTGDNSQYLGEWQIYNADAAADRAGVLAVFENAKAMGGDPGTMKADSIRLWNNGAIAVAPQACANGPLAPANRGIALEGPARFATVSNETWSLGMPVSGTGSLRKTGKGTVRLCGAYAATGGIVVEAGTLSLASGFSAPNGLAVPSVEPGATLAVEATSTAGLSLANVALPTGVRFSGFAGSGTVGGISLAASCTLGAGPYAISLAGDTSLLAAGSSWTVLTIPTAVRTVSADDFRLLAADGVSRAPYDLSVAEKDGVQSVCLRVRPIVRLSDAVAQANPGTETGWWQISDAETWEDGLVPSRDKDYLADKSVYNTLRTAPMSTPYVFQGGSLTIAGGNWLALKSDSITISNLVLNSYSGVNSAGGSVPVQTLAGTIIVDDSAVDKPAALYSTEAQGLRVESAIAGRGFLYLRPYSTTTVTNAAELTMTGDNSEFLGKFFITSNGAKDPRFARAMTVAFTHPEALGGPLPAFQHDYIRLDNNCWLKPLASMTYEAANRGIRASDMKAGIDVGKGIDFNIKTDFSITGAIWKEGEGTLGLGGRSYIGTPTWDASSTLVGQRGIIRAQEGRVKALDTTFFKQLKLVFGVRGGLAVDATPTDSQLAQYGLFNTYVAHGEDTEGSFVLEGDDLPVSIDGLPQVVPIGTRVVLFTVPAETAAKVSGKIRVRAPRCSAEIETDQVTIDSVTYTRFTAVLAPRGLLFYVQ